jgi:hypothetical protein
MGGDKDQKLTRMSTSRHKNLHKEMNDFLKEQTNVNGNNMYPKKGNSGHNIQNNFSTMERMNALKTFYDSHTVKYFDARYDFYRNNNFKWMPW